MILLPSISPFSLRLNALIIPFPSSLALPCFRVLPESMETLVSVWVSKVLFTVTQPQVPCKLHVLSDSVTLALRDRH